MLHSQISSLSLDIVFIVETWLSAKIPDIQICPPGYKIIRKDRISKKGGGVLVLYKNKFPIVEIHNMKTDDVEYLSIDLVGNKKKNSIRFTCFYVPPDLSCDHNTIEKLCKCIKKHSTKYSNYIIGDFNMPSINWKCLSSSTSVGKQFLNFSIENSLVQRVHEPTTIYDSLLDLILCDNASFKQVNSIEVLQPLTMKCDHSMVNFSLEYNHLETAYSNIPNSFSYERGNYTEINNRLSLINWHHVFNYYQNDIQKIYDFFLETVHSLVK